MSLASAVKVIADDKPIHKDKRDSENLFFTFIFIFHLFDILTITPHRI